MATKLEGGGGGKATKKNFLRIPLINIIPSRLRSLNPHVDLQLINVQAHRADIVRGAM